jgi:hypothetical protein
MCSGGGGGLSLSSRFLSRSRSACACGCSRTTARRAGIGQRRSGSSRARWNVSAGNPSRARTAHRPGTPNPSQPPAVPGLGVHPHRPAPCSSGHRAGAGRRLPLSRRLAPHTHPARARRTHRHPDRARRLVVAVYGIRSGVSDRPAAIPVPALPPWSAPGLPVAGAPHVLLVRLPMAPCRPARQLPVAATGCP